MVRIGYRQTFGSEYSPSNSTMHCGTLGSEGLFVWTDLVQNMDKNFLDPKVEDISLIKVFFIIFDWN